MNSVVKFLLEEYLNNPSEMRLKILVGNLNPEFKLTKSSKAQIQELLNSYQTNKNPLSIKALEKLVSSQIKPLKTKKTSIQSSTIQAQYDLLNLQLKSAKEAKDKDAAQALKMEMNLLLPKMDEEVKRIELSLNKSNPIDYEVQELKKTFGDYENDINSIGYKIVNNKISKISMGGMYNPAQLIERLFVLTGNHPIKWAAMMNMNGVWTAQKGEEINVGSEERR